jgi:Bacteriophage probable baseplate hub protein
MPLFQLLPDSFVPTFEMTVNFVPLPLPIARTVMDLSVTERLDPPNQFGFRLNDRQLKLIDPRAGLFTEGSRVEISFGFVGNTSKLITGEISALTADFPNSGPATLQVDGFDLLHRLTRGTCYRTFAGPTPDSGLPDSQIVTQIAGEMQLIPAVDPTPVRTEPRVQNHVTNMAFLEELAHASGFFLWVEGETLFFKRQRTTPDAIRLEWGKTLLSFSPRLSIAGQVNAVEVRGWDAIQKQSFSVRVARSDRAVTLAPTARQRLAQGSGGRSELVVIDAPVASAQEARTYAEAMLALQQQTIVTGTGTAVGRPDLRVGTTLELRGIGRFDGSYLVEQATHTLGDSGYQTSFQVRTAS